MTCPTPELPTFVARTAIFGPSRDKCGQLGEWRGHGWGGRRWRGLTDGVVQ